MEGVVVEELEHCIAMAKAQFKVAKESLAIAKTKKDASIVATQKVCSQMEDRNNHLLEVETTLQP
jgi:hypothetical protein